LLANYSQLMEKYHPGKRKCPKCGTLVVIKDSNIKGK